MKNKKKQIALLGLTAAIAMTAACGKQEEQGNGGTTGQQGNESSVAKTGFPIVKEPVKLKFIAGKAASTAPNWNDIMLFNKYEEMTGIDIEWQMIGTEVLSEQRNLILASGELPDAFYGALIPDRDVMRYGEQGTFIKLNDLIDQYAPNIKKLLEDNPDVKKGLTMPDGNIYSIPRIYDPSFDSVLINPKQWINKEWMDKLGLTAPQTTEELYQFLKAIKGQDLNGNGKADEVPFGTDNIGKLMKYLYGAWNLQNKGSRHDYVDVDPATNKLRFFPADERYKEVLQYVNRLYQEKLIDQDLFTINATEFLARTQGNVYGMYSGWDPISWANLSHYTGAPALAGPHGDKTVVKNSSLVSLGNFVITSANKHPEATMRWIDHFFSDEGSKMFFMGFEGITYKQNSDGSVDYVDEITKNPKGLTIDQAVIQYLVWPGGGAPGIVSEKYFRGGETLPASLETAKQLAPFAKGEAWPPFSYTNEENARMSALASDLSTYIKEMQAKFITGKALFSEWDAYVKTLKKMGMDEYMEFYQAAYERYKK
ncbi:ABC transporter substrate-binding protein [Paenibacillus sp. J31TS4]|uniref:extracellular solute-binding protein n=1 Tax=Paenibacillus sp. J31TS4 TaxID=2807195 RepID=UPI001AFEAD74|nr:extracellular solute-binding protein [Paenibacillus sp. J31TS4]GIP40122.1 ABC transporter substrate-binding protein [Paenibacillus sp. J31TS4]